MVINKKLILSLRPCQNRLDNYLKFYDKKSLTLSQFMGLKNITQQDKLWVIFRLMPKENIALAAADMAESVLYIFEAERPNDKRPRQAIEAARGKGDAPAAAAAAVRAADSVAVHATDYSDNSPARAAYSAAYAARSAIALDPTDSATYSVAVRAAYSTVDLARAASHHALSSTSKTRDVQNRFIRKICLKYMKVRK